MYDTNFKCTYHYVECGEQIYGYQKDMLSMFNLSQFDDNEINQNVEALYNLMKDSEEMCECMKIAANSLMSEDSHTGFILLFSFDYLHITSKCISSYLNKDMDSFNKHVDCLKKKITTK